ncbi:hypothetical protein D1872_107170 [compost metagenome]
MDLIMSNEEYESIKTFISNKLEEANVSKIYINELFETYNNPNSSINDYNSIELRISKNIFNINNTNFNYEKSNNKINEFIKNEINNLICTKSIEYRQERINFIQFFDKVVPIISAAVAAKFGTTSSLCTGLVSLLLVSVFKVGRNAWCRYYGDNSKAKDAEK